MNYLNMFELNEWTYDFKTMMSYYKGDKYPLRYDDEGDIVDFFDWSGDQFWIDCGEATLKAYKSYKAESILLTETIQI